MAAKIKSGVYRCDAGFVAADKNGTVRVAANSIVPYDHPYDVMAGREHLFTDVSKPKGEGNVSDITLRTVEQATAAPGEQRTRK